MEQINIFADLEAQEHQKAKEKMFQEWLALPAELLIPSSAPERPGVLEDLRHGYCERWSEALHRCPGLPDDRYIWLNEVEPPEYWVMNQVGSPCGEHIETCPFCGADLKHGGGDVVLQKADGGWWHIQGFIKKGDQKDDKG